MEELPGNIYEKIGDLRTAKGLTKKELSEALGIPASQLTRIENEEIKSISHELVIRIAEYFNVSTDYLLGQTDTRFRKNVELDELGLTHKAMVTLLSGKVNTELLSRIIENHYFIPLMDYAESYFDGAHDVGFLGRNDMIDLAVTDINEYIAANPMQAAEGRKDIRKLNAEKITGSEADIEKLKNIFLKMLKEVKDDFAEPKKDISNEEMRAQVKELHRDAINAKKKNTLDEQQMAQLTLQMLKPGQFDKTEQKMIQELMMHVMKRQRK